MQPYALKRGEGRRYVWHDVVFTIKSAEAETGGAVAIWEATTRPGEEPQVHTHADIDEIFYVISGAITFRCGGSEFALSEGGFVFLPRGVAHGYTIDSAEVRLLGMSTPSSFADHIEETGTPV